jgi:hypothetical protein
MRFDHEDVTVLILVFVLATVGGVAGFQWEPLAAGAAALYALYLIGKGRT